VYERDYNKDVRVQGATLDLHDDSGLKAIEKAGMLDIFKKTYRPGADKGRVVDKHARIIYDEHGQESAADFGSEAFRPEIDRGDLRNILLESLIPGTVVWDSHLTAISQAGGAWILAFKNGVTASADIVIGADGANSKIRPFVTYLKPFYAGIIIVQGNLEESKAKAPRIDQLLKGGKIYVHSDGKYLHVSAKGDGSIDFYVSSKMDENWAEYSGIDFSDRSQLLTWFEHAFEGWDRIWFELFENVSLPLLIRPQYCMPLDQSWDSQSSITLLGDAAHIMPPSGEGVNLAMLDALELSECLTGVDFKDIQTAIAAYEKQMQTRAAAEAEDSLDSVAWMHSEGAACKLISMFKQSQSKT
jgi:2-polyprenyl-6-methoxyphenol hydroxylase-like FAD-dependent oxidoreductase